ncbi:MAG: M6 family metalloprotease domain-containing protein [Bacteroidaceae bacterium]|nr:M6 family metalloprotease domain-containing protein [Bacteroidaceae bacterium]
MKKLIFSALIAVLGIATALAVPAKPGVKKTITLKDGTSVEATLVGDEHVHFYQTADRRTIQKVGGVYQYVNRDSLVQLHAERMAERNQLRARRAPVAPRKIAYSGKKRGLVIMVEFSDVKFTYDKATFEDYFNKTGFNQDGMAGSVHDYFYEQSYGEFDLEFDVVGPVTLPQTAAYYAEQDTRVPKMVNDVCKQVDSEVDYSLYDWDGDKYVDQVYVIYAGYGEAQGAENTIWPHEWSVRAGVSSGYRTAEGVRIETYGISCELMGNGKTNTGHLDGIGTSCHEFSHCLGLPDFYDTAHNDGTAGNFGMGTWDLMDTGCYNGSANGRSPSGYTAYERWFGGWLEPIVLDHGQKITDMPAIQDEPVAYIIYNDAHKDEYYLLANHQLKSFDKAAYGHGMLVLHVDYDESAWSSNVVNNETGHQRMTIIPADNAQTMTGTSLAADPFPGTRRKKELTNTSTPKAELYNANPDGEKLMSKPITNITEAQNLISFDFMGGMTLDAPVVLEPTEVGETGFTANWEPVEGATSYTVSLLKTVEGEEPDEPDPDSNVLLEEDFSGFNGVASSLTKDISSSLDNYTALPGWTGSNLYAYNNLLRVGKSGSTGMLYSPTVAAPSTESFTMLIAASNAATSGTATATIYLLLPDGRAASVALEDLATPSEGVSTWLVPASSWPYGEFQVVVYPETSGSGVYMHYLQVLDGVYSWDDLSSPKAQVRRAPVTTTTEYTTAETSYTFTDLETTATYSYKVRANAANSVVSDWSDEMSVELATLVQQVVDVLPAMGATYLLDGRQASGSLRPGIYVRNGRKFVVK